MCGRETFRGIGVVGGNPSKGAPKKGLGFRVWGLGSASLGNPHLLSSGSCEVLSPGCATGVLESNETCAASGKGSFSSGFPSGC